MCRELVTKAGDQRPGSIIVKIDREELKREVRGERDGGWRVLAKRNEKGVERPGSEFELTWWYQKYRGQNF